MKRFSERKGKWETVETEPTREERIKIVTSCLDSQRAKDLFTGLAAIFTDAGVFWDVDEQSAGLEDEDILITIQS